MLTLKDIVKTYTLGEEEVHALKGVNLSFRKSEFVSILGPSGCGKTTLLNLVGGLDRYTSGDLVINKKSTKDFSDRDWDTYRNHSIGFVFQSYNLIPHQTVLANVELALTISGEENKAERRRRAIEVLEKVGLGNQLKKKPNQMSGGQMQRVAIARAIVNNPDILLADEPTGALDTETSVAIMDVLKEIAKDRLVIMVTHNPDLAEKYSNRIINLLDGEVIGDSNPYTPEEEKAEITAERIPQQEPSTKKGRRKKKKHSSMSFWTAINLSFNNLLSKKGRTFLTSFAGSIGIIGIALILSLSNGITLYIDQLQEETLSSYPIVLERNHMDMGDLLSSASNMMGGSEEEKVDHKGENVIYPTSDLEKIMSTMADIATNSTKENNLKEFKKFLDSNGGDISQYTAGVQYVYDVDLNAYYKNKVGDTYDYYKAQPTELMENLSNALKNNKNQMASTMIRNLTMMGSNLNFFGEMIQGVAPSKNPNAVPDILYDQYDVVKGRWPDFSKTAGDYKEEGCAEVVVVVDKYNEISRLALYALGILPYGELVDQIEIMIDAGGSEGAEIGFAEIPYTYEQILDWEFKLVLPGETFEERDLSGHKIWTEKEENDIKASIGENNLDIKVVGIVRPKENAVATAISSTIGYTRALTEYIINNGALTPAAIAQAANPKVDIFTGFNFADNSSGILTDELVDAYISMLVGYMEAISDSEIIQGTMKDFLTSAKVEGNPKQSLINICAKMNEMIDGNPTFSSILPMLSGYIGDVFENNRFDADKMEEYILSDDFTSISTYEKNMEKLGCVDYSNPIAINIFSNTFENKDKIAEIIKNYNAQVRSEMENMTEEELKTYEKTEITYTDYIGLILSTVTMMIDAVTYGLIAFVAISLIVSSIMIGIITYISVLERRKEIGILRAVGARKIDVSNVFNAETLMLGLASGVLGILITLLLTIPINLILGSLTGIPNMCSLPWAGALILIGISMLLTFVSGLIPASIAAKKDPVEALRSE